MAGKNASAGEKLSTRAGWSELRRAAEELHAAEILLGDPVAPSRTATPHLREFWSWAAKAGAKAGIGAGEGAGEDPQAWLAAEQSLVDAKLRAKMRAQLEALELGPGPRALRAHAKLARKLLATLEPEIGGVPLRRRRRRVLWSTVAAVVLFTPVLVYTALQTEVPGTGPWRAAYYPDRKLESDPIVMRNDTVDHDWKSDAPIEELPPDKWSVRWDSCLVIDEPRELIFQLKANDGARVFIDGETVIDAWGRDKKTRRRGFGSGKVELDAGVHHIRVEYFESMGVADIKLVASLDGKVPKALPRERLRYPGDEFDEEDPCAAVR